jgi:SAM-dependent methyltransferase
MSLPSPSVEEIWRRYDADEIRLSAPLSERMIELAKLKPGMHVLDLATGRGEPAIRAAHKVGPLGQVLGVDISDSMLRMARERADAEGIHNLSLIHGSAEQLPDVPTNHFDATLARWCLMYFENPMSALKAAHAAMRPNASFIAAVWAEPERVNYHTLPRTALKDLIPLPPVDVMAPGPFYYSNADRLCTDLEAAGFKIECCEEMQIDVMEATTDAELVHWTRCFGLNRILKDQPESIQSAWESKLIESAQPLRKDGIYRLGGISHIVSATKIDNASNSPS